MTRTRHFVGLAVFATIGWLVVAGAVAAHAQVTTADVIDIPRQFQFAAKFLF